MDALKSPNFYVCWRSQVQLEPRLQVSGKRGNQVTRWRKVGIKVVSDKGCIKIVVVALSFLFGVQKWIGFRS